MHSWNQPVPSNKAMVSCLVKQQEPLIGFESTTAHYKKRLFTSYNNKRSLILIFCYVSVYQVCQKIVKRLVDGHLGGLESLPNT